MAENNSQYLDLEGLKALWAKICAQDSLLAEKIIANANAIAELKGDFDNAIEDAVKQAVAEIVDGASESFDTLKEIEDWINGHPDGAAGMNALIQANTKNIDKIFELLEANKDEDEVKAKRLDKIEEKVTEVEKEIEKIEAIYETKNYEFSSLLSGCRVLQNEKEYRIMFPFDTSWKTQVGGGDPDSYYFAMKAYAPEGAVSFREDTKEQIEDLTMFDFNDKFAGTDKYGRNYSIVWLPAAVKDEDGNWKYWGEDSTTSKYIGWFYTVEWYDAAGKVISSDTIKINLSNEECHNYSRPWYIGEYAKKSEVAGTIDSIPIEDIDDLTWTSPFED